ncbi:hypothetical protein GCM10010252_63610 [Streptomyces aureoverticillatus]|nr:hypothetical protein GCM10010252_63610 [Streptomyces aureoverticillatus]
MKRWRRFRRRPEKGPARAADSALDAAAARHEQFAATGDPAFLEQAITLATQASRGADCGAADAVPADLMLGELWCEQAMLNGSAQALGTALNHARRALAAAEARATESPHLTDACRLTLAYALRLRYEQQGDPADLDEAIGLLGQEPANGQNATSGASLSRSDRSDRSDPSDPSDRLDRLNRLGFMLTRRFEHHHDLADLDRAIQVLTDAGSWARAWEDERALASISNNLGSAHNARFHRTGDTAALDAAISHYRTAVDSSFPDAPQRPTRLTNLAQALHSRFTSTGQIRDLLDALKASETALRCTSGHDTERSRRLGTHAALLMTHYQVSRNPSLRERAIALGRTALAGESGELHRAEFLSRHATHLLLPHLEPTGTAPPPTAPSPSARPTDADLDEHQLRHMLTTLRGTSATAVYEEALDLYDRALRQEGSLIHDRGRAARRWATLVSLRDLDAAIDGAGAALDLLATIDWPGMRIPDRLAALHDWAGFPCLAAGWAVERGRLLDAVQLLELGRGRLWAQIAETRTPPAVSSPAARQLADQLHDVHTELNRLAAPRPGTAPAAPHTSDAPRGERLRRLNKERRRLLAELRGIEGLEDFLGPPSPHRLHAAVGAGPVVLLNVTARRCDALVLTDTGGDLGIELVPLPGLRSERAAGTAQAFDIALTLAHTARRRLLRDRRDGRRSAPVDRAAFHGAMEELRMLLEWGWEAVTQPVLQALGHRAPRAEGETWPRVWWVPTGPLTRIPLHATGHHDGSGDAVIDRVASSDATTVSALAEANRRHRSAQPDRLLCAAVPQPPHESAPLVAVPHEAAAVAAHAPVPVTRLDGPRATRAAIVTGLSGHTWFHFAGHGTTSITDPGDAALSAFEAPLTLADIATALHGHAELAFLSSCHGSTADATQPDEAVHLAAAFHTAGFRHTVAARHVVEDGTAQQLATSFYEHLSRAGDPGLALHHTLRTLRAELSRAAADDDLVHRFAWIHHTHLGPAGSVLPVPQSPG